MTEATQPQTQPLLLALKSGMWSNTFHHEALFSVKRNKFINARPRKADWKLLYLIYPGHYVKFMAWGFRDSRGMSLWIVKDTIDADGSEHYEFIVRYEDVFDLEWFEKLADDPECPEALKDFIKSLPQSYHRTGHAPDPTKVYAEDEIQRVKEYLERKVRELAEG